MAADASFQFVTNAASVAREVEQSMGRIGRALRQAQTQVTAGGSAGGGLGNVEQQFFGGVRQRLLNVSGQLDRSMQKLGTDLEQRIRSGEKVNVGTEVQRLVQRTQQDLTSLAQDVARGIPAPLRSKLPEIQSIMETEASSIVRGAESIYQRIATRLRQVANEVGTKGVTVPGVQRMQRGDLSGVIGGNRGLLRDLGRAIDLQAVQTSGLSPDQRQAAFSGIMGKGGFGLSQGETNQAMVGLQRDQMAVAREALNRTRKHQAEVAAAEQARLVAEQEQASLARAETEAMRRNRLEGARVFREIAQNRDVRGNPRDLAGARIDPRSGLIYDAQGNSFRYDQTSGGVVPAQSQLAPGGRGGIGDLRPRSAEDFDFRQGMNELLDEERRNALVNKDLQRKLAVERERVLRMDKERAAKDARATDHRLARELKAGQAVRLQGSNIIRDAQGAYYSQGRSGAYAVDPQSTRLQRALARNEELVQAQAQREARTRARNQALAEASRGQGIRRPGTQGFFDRAFGPGHGGTGRAGFSMDDILTTGLSFGRYMASAALFGVVAGALAEVKTATLDYRDSLTDLNVALGRSESASKGFLDTLGETSRLAGENPGAALDAAARGIRAFGAGIDSLEGKEKVGEAFADAVTQLAVIGSKTLEDAAGDMIAIANNFSIAEDNLSRINDAIASAKQTIGGDPTQIAQGLAAVGSAAQEAGYNVEETANIISLVQSRTDQSGRAVATRLARIFSIVGGSSGRSAIERLNRELGSQEQIDTNATVSEQLRQLGQVYDNLTGSQQQQLRAALGGTANTKELIPLLEEQGLLAEALGKSYENSGEGLDEFVRKSQDLRGTVKRIAGDVQNIVVQLGNAGMFDLFVIGIEALEPFLNSLVQLLQVYNELPGPMKHILAITLQLAAAQKLYAMYLNARLGGVGSVSELGRQGARRAIFARRQSDVIRDAATRRGYQVLPEGQFITRTDGGAFSRINTRQRLLGFGQREIPTPRAFLRGVGTLALGRAQARQALSQLGAGTPWRGRLAGAGMGLFGATDPAGSMGRMGMATRTIRELPRAFAEVARQSGVMLPTLTQMGTAMKGFAATVRTQVVGAVSGLATSMRGALNAIDPLTLSILGLIGVVSAFNATRAQLNAQAAAQEGVGRSVTGGTDLRGEAQARQQLAEESERAGGFFGSIADFIGGSQGAEAEAALRREAAGLSRAADEIEEARARAARGDGPAGAAIDVAVEGGIQEGLSRMSDSGRNAKSQIDALNAAMQELADRADAAASALTPTQQIEFANLAAPNILSEFEARRQSASIQRNATFNPWDARRWTNRRNDYTTLIESLDTEAQGEISNLIAEFTQAAGGDLDSGQMDVLADLVLQEIDKYGGLEGRSEEFRDEVRGIIEFSIGQTRKGLSEFEDIAARFDEYLAAAIGLAQGAGDIATIAAQLGNGRSSALAGIDSQMAELQKARGIASADPDVTAEQLEAIDLEMDRLRIERISALRDQIDLYAKRDTSELAKTDSVGRAQVAVQALRDQIKVTRDRDELIGLRADLRDAEQALADAELERANAMWSAHYDSRDTVGQAYAAAMVAYNNLVSITNTGDESSAAYWQARQAYADALVAQQRAETERMGAYRKALVDPRDTVGDLSADLATLWDQYRNALPGSQEQHELTRQINETSQQLQQEQVAIANAATQAGVDPASSLQKAAADLTAAQRELALALPGTQDYYNALGSLNEAQVALADAELEAASIRRQLAIDLTDPVANAEEELRSVRARIAAAVARGAPDDVVDQLRVEEQQAMAQAEAAAFDQRLSDVQIAEQLGRISHQAYIQYLESESARLHAIQDRTRQQTDQMNQVDLLLKEASETAAGIWNIGDIKMPTPYEVRRAIEAQAQGMTLGESFRATQSVNATRVTNDNRQAYITVNGADIETFKALLADYFGPSTVRRSSTGVSGGRT